MDKNLPVGVIDSGVGGLSVLKVLQQALPHEDFLYIGDTARTPYGQRPEKEIRAMVHDLTDYLDNAGIKLLVVACNTITVLGTESIRNGYAFDVVGMSKGAELALGVTKNKKIGVMATPFTVASGAHKAASGAHKAAVNALDADAEVFAQGCPDFVPLIEQGVFSGAAIEDAVARYSAPLKEAGVDTVLLSCTHYPRYGFRPGGSNRLAGKNFSGTRRAFKNAGHGAQQGLLYGRVKPRQSHCGADA